MLGGLWIKKKLSRDPLFVVRVHGTTVSIPESGTVVEREPYQPGNSSTSSTNVLCSLDAHYKRTDNEASHSWTEIPTKTSRNRKVLVLDQIKTGPGIKTALRSSNKSFENGG